MRNCVTLVLQDGRELVCTPDHELLRSDGRWVRADQLELGRDRVVMGLEAPLDEPGDDERDYVLEAGELRLEMNDPEQRRKALAFARLLGHLLGDGSISVAGQGRMHVGQALDREAVLADIELVTGKRPAASRYDDLKWSIVLPLELTRAALALDGVTSGRRIAQSHALPAIIEAPECPVALVREFLGGMFGADGRSGATSGADEKPSPAGVLTHHDRGTRRVAEARDGERRATAWSLRRRHRRSTRL